VVRDDQPDACEGQAGRAGVGELLLCRHCQSGISGDRQLQRSAVAPQAQVQTTQGWGISRLAPLRALWARTSDPAWTRRVVGEGVRSCPRPECERSARPVRRGGCGNGAKGAQNKSCSKSYAKGERSSWAKAGATSKASAGPGKFHLVSPVRWVSAPTGGPRERSAVL
jgi:hypothetical protein